MDVLTVSHSVACRFFDVNIFLSLNWYGDFSLIRMC